MMRDTLEVLLAADLEAADRDAVAGYVKRSHELRSWLDAFQVRCVRRTDELAAQGRSEPADSLITLAGSQSARDGRVAGRRAVVCDLFVLFERALAAGEIGAGHVDALGVAIRDLDDEQRFGLIDREDALLAAARRMRVDDFARHARAQAADVVAQLAQIARASSVASAPTETGSSVNDATDDSSADDVTDSAGRDDPPSPLVDPAVVEYERQRAASKMRRWRDAETGMCMTLLALDPIRDAMLTKAYDRHLNTLRATGATNALPWRQVEVDAILHAIVHGVTRPDSDRTQPTTADDLNRLRTAAHRPVDANTPDAAATVPEICVVAGIDRVLDDCCTHGLCETSNGQPLPAASLRRMLCDAVVYPAILGGHGEILDAGRTRRTVTPQQRRALRAMQRTCAHPGCTVGFDSCRIHHIRWWTRDHGPTDIDNLLPLCETHHHLVHEGGWTLTMTPDRTATWTRPDGTHWQTVNTNDRGADISATAPMFTTRTVEMAG